MSKALRRVILSLVSFAAACAPLSAQQPAAVPTGLILSKLSKQALDKTFKHWQVAAVDPKVAACWRGEGNPPAFARGDLNSDGQPDLALAVKANDGVHLVAIFERLTDSVVVTVDTFTGQTVDGYLAIERRGSAFQNPDDHLQDYFTSDTLAVYRCGQPRTVYFWSGLGFRKSQLKAPTAAAAASLLQTPEHAF